MPAAHSHTETLVGVSITADQAADDILTRSHLQCRTGSRSKLDGRVVIVLCKKTRRIFPSMGSLRQERCIGLGRTWSAA